MKILPCSPRPELNALIQAVKNRPPMTKAEIALQHKFWVIGEMILEHPDMSREEAERIYDSVEMMTPEFRLAISREGDLLPLNAPVFG
jgi:hypothetical protein